ncbi:hypothetical protein ONS95_004907 [Cadophora gregata]|uniref:uncharacterized protein n=1 Tax=Cadophora gregata TaxID=51156 RepID=UPI0026DD8FFD|nr:uncharacterized protein ONS95_004907 [Cadophora gregata]KAK0104621.1 hypothetical protein ONS95_004907 [Cadophora gregata]KAK0115290.1 hypothetical protein ONS96_013749 [Cadophora gregata f. sp. sojae]
MEELLGCWREAQRADKAVVQLLRIRAVLDLEFYDHITAVLREIESTSRLLRDLYDLFPIYRSRVPIIIYYLDVILPSLERTIKNMMVYIDNDAFPARTQWTLTVERLGDQGGMSLPTVFVMYVEFLVQIVRLLSRSPLYDPTTLELLRMRHLRLRLLQGIPAPPSPAIPHHAPIQPTEADLERRHWAEKIFDDQPHSTTGLRHRRESMCFGPPMVDVKLGITPGSSVLFKLPFDKNRLSVTLYLQPEGPDMTRLLCRWLDRYMNPLTACYGVHELCVRRKGSSLQFRRWSLNKMHPKLWMALFFKTWEKMVLFHCAFGALKSRCPLTISVTSEDVCLPGEKRLFQGKIIDDGFEHILTVLQDLKCGGIRLHAAVRSGELRRCPVWTAFITHQSSSPQWLDRRSRHRIWLRDIYPYVFCQKYKKKHQMKRNGEFELYFVTEDAADAFQDMFQEGSDTGGGDGRDIIVVTQERS